MTQKVFMACVAFGVMGLSLFMIKNHAVGQHDDIGEPPVYSVEVNSKYHTIDRVYKSMIGPEDVVDFKLTKDAAPELVWIVGAYLEVVDKDGNPTSGEFICHTSFYSENASLYTKDALIGETNPHHVKSGPGSEGFLGYKFLDINQGATDIKFPQGFGIPQMSDEPLIFNSMIMNHQADKDPFDIQVRARLDYVRDKDLKAEMKSLDLRIIYTELTVNGRTGAHWMVPPGRHEYRTFLNKGLGLPDDVSVHLITAHMHPYAESVELWDRKEDKLVFKANAKNFSDKIGVQHIDHFASTQGMELYKDHIYEIKSVYDNPTDKPIDAMGMLYIFYHEPGFDKTMVRKS